MPGTAPLLYIDSKRFYQRQFQLSFRSIPIFLQRHKRNLNTATATNEEKPQATKQASQPQEQQAPSASRRGTACTTISKNSVTFRSTPSPYPVPLFLPLRKKFTRKWTAPPSPALNSCSVTVTLARYRCRAARPVISPQPRPARRPARRSTRQSAARTTVPAGRRRRQRGRQTPAESHRQQTISGCNKCIQQLQ